MSPSKSYQQARDEVRQTEDRYRQTRLQRDRALTALGRAGFGAALIEDGHPVFGSAVDIDLDAVARLLTEREADRQADIARNLVKTREDATHEATHDILRLVLEALDSKEFIDHGYMIPVAIAFGELTSATRPPARYDTAAFKRSLEAKIALRKQEAETKAQQALADRLRSLATYGSLTIPKSGLYSFGGYTGPHTGYTAPERIIPSDVVMKFGTRFLDLIADPGPDAPPLNVAPTLDKPADLQGPTPKNVRNVRVDSTVTANGVKVPRAARIEGDEIVIDWDRVAKAVNAADRVTGTLSDDHRALLEEIRDRINPRGDAQVEIVDPFAPDDDDDTDIWRGTE